MKKKESLCAENQKLQDVGARSTKQEWSKIELERWMGPDSDESQGSLDWHGLCPGWTVGVCGLKMRRGWSDFRLERLENTRINQIRWGRRVSECVCVCACLCAHKHFLGIFCSIRASLKASELSSMNVPWAGKAQPLKKSALGAEAAQYVLSKLLWK